MVVSELLEFLVAAVLHRMGNEHERRVDTEDFAWAAAPSMNSVVATPTVGMPRPSRSAMSCVQHEMQDP